MLQGVDDHVRCILSAGAEMEYGKNLREGIDGQPEPEHLCGAAQPCAQFVQLEVREPQIARCERWCKVCAYSPARVRKASDGGLPVAEDTLCSGRIQPKGSRSQRDCDPAREGVFKRYKGVWRRAESGAASRASKGLDLLSTTMGAFSKEARGCERR